MANNSLIKVFLFGALFNLIFVLTAQGTPQEQPILPEDIKAVFLYNFTKFFQWPNLHSKSEFTITVFGNSKVMGPLHIIAKKKKAKGKTIVLNNINDIRLLENSQIVFVAISASNELQNILKKINGKPTLIVGEKEGVLNRGLGINFVEKSGKVRFEISRKNIEKAGLKVSSQLLKLAVTVE